MRTTVCSATAAWNPGREGPSTPKKMKIGAMTMKNMAVSVKGTTGEPSDANSRDGRGCALARRSGAPASAAAAVAASAR